MNNVVLTQNNLNTVINAVQQNSSIVSDVVKATATSLKNVVKTTSDLSHEVALFNSLDKVMGSYTSIVTKVINTLCGDLPGESKNLNELLGHVIENERQKDGTFKQVTKYTIIDAAMQIPQVINGTIEVMEKLADFKSNFKSINNIKKNISLLKMMIGDVMSELINMFSDMVSQQDIDKLLKSLVKQPDTVHTLVENNANYKDDKLEGKDLSKTTTDTVSGQLGLLDIFEKTFSLVGLLNSMKVPNLVVLNVKLLKLRLALRSSLWQLVGFYDNLIKRNNGKDPLESVNSFGLLIAGNDDSANKKIGLFTLINKLNLLMNVIKDLKIGIKEFALLYIGIKMIVTILNLVVQVINSEQVAALSNDVIYKRIDRVNKNIGALSNTIKSLTIAALLSIIFVPLCWTIPLAIMGIGLIITTINKFLADKEIGDVTIFDDLETIIENIISISKSILLLGAISPLILIASWAVSILFIIGFIPVMWAAHCFAIVASKRQILQIKMSLSFFESMIKSLVVTGLLIIAFALLSPIIISAIIIGFLPMMGALLLMSGFLWLTFKIIGKLSLQTVPNILSFGASIAIILGTLAISALLIFMVAKIQQNLEGFGAWGKVALMLLGMIALTAIVVLLGIGVSALTAVIVPAMLGFGQILVIFGMLVIMGISINLLAKTELNIGDENTKGTAKYNVKQIFEFAKYLRQQLRGEDGKDRILGGTGKWRRDKKMLKQVERSVNEIVDIANKLNTLQKIDIKKDTLLGIDNKSGVIGNIFTIVNLIEQQLNDFNNLNDKGKTTKGEQRRNRKRMRRNKQVLTKVDRITNKIVDIAEDLISIKDFGITSEEWASISLGITNIFDCIEKVDNEIKLRNNAAAIVKNDSGEEIKDIVTLREERRLARRNKKVARQNKKQMTKIGSIMETLVGVIDAVESIKEFKWDVNDEQLTKKVDIIFKSINQVSASITKNKNIPTSTELEKLQPVIDYLCTFSDSTKDLAEVNSDNLKNNIDNYVRFIDKVNTVEVSKLEKSAQMFQQMANFSNSIKGNFEKLAESINEDLMPVLEELKEIMEKVPTAIETNGANVSAAVASTTVAPTTTNVTKQVERENPGMDKKQVEQLVQARLKEHANSAANSTASKIDELINLLKGYSGDHVVVQTI